MTRTRAWRRHKDYIKARRKQRLDQSYNTHTWWVPWYPNLHEYSKNKIHCSCPICRRKTKNHGAAALYNGTYNPSLHDKRVDEAIKQEVEEWERNEETEN